MNNEETKSIIDRFNERFNAHDVDGIMALMTDDCVFDSTGPAPDGNRVEGQAAVRAVWESLFRDSPDARFDGEDMIVAGDRCTVQWVYHFTDGDGNPGHIRGIDLFRVRDGKVAEKFAYVKGYGGLEPSG